ncbi:glycosyltransferase family 2 protein [Sporomusa sphaeroides DSM 2875]|uniref:glycosyltransferase family 2 protein n=1 Tax=Sporomusa sphaeroides TaxID=47679 RepID=UPI00202EA0EF|nr:glycosyltransferase family 2 protein [Sporomusa sphaeroides]MCM0758032.1 glycosyltransferase family 2 protein [Sporomusa sphaeroides DSM 2875]
MNAPIVLFVYNRPQHTRLTLEALQKNILAEETELYIFSDSPKITGNDEKDAKTIELVAEVRNVIRRFTGFKKVNIREQECNQGLANSIISGVTEIIHQYGKVIVVEDDLVSSPYFLSYMNNALAFYENEQRVFNISAFSFPSATLEIPQEYPFDTYFLTRNSSWGWGTWCDRWDKAIWDHSQIQNMFKDRRIRMELEKGGTNLVPILEAQLAEKIDSWSIRWSFTLSCNNGVSLTPLHSYIHNIGFDGTGVHCGDMGDATALTSDLSLAKRVTTFPDTVEVQEEIARRFALCYGDMPFLLHSSVELKDIQDTLQSTVQSLRKQVEELHYEKDELAKELQNIYSSNSWKITAPLRLFFILIKKIFGR